MTLILSLINRNQAIQISDRRSMSVNGTWVDNLNKAFVCISEDARSIVGFTGLAEVGVFKTYRWIGEALMEAFKPDFMIQLSLNRFTEMASNKFLELTKKVDNKNRRLSIVFTGYQYNEDPPRAYAWLVSNFDALDSDKYSDTAKRQFTISSLREKRPEEDRLALVWVNGMDLAISDEQLRSFGNHAKSQNEQDILNEGLQLLRNAADSPLSHNFISKNCTSVILPSKLSISAIIEYYTEDQKGITFTPGLLVARKKEGIYFIAEATLSQSGYIY